MKFDIFIIQVAISWLWKSPQLPTS